MALENDSVILQSGYEKPLWRDFIRGHTVSEGCPECPHQRKQDRHAGQHQHAVQTNRCDPSFDDITGRYSHLYAFLNSVVFMRKMLRKSIITSKIKDCAAASPMLILRNAVLKT